MTAHDKCNSDCKITFCFADITVNYGNQINRLSVRRLKLIFDYRLQDYSYGSSSSLIGVGFVDVIRSIASMKI